MEQHNNNSIVSSSFEEGTVLVEEVLVDDEDMEHEIIYTEPISPTSPPSSAKGTRGKYANRTLRKEIKRDEVVVHLYGKGVIFKCTKEQLIKSIANNPGTYCPDDSPEFSKYTKQGRRDLHFDRMLQCLQEEVSADSLCFEEREFIDETLREVWRSIRDTFKKALDHGRGDRYKYSGILQFYRKWYEQEKRKKRGREKIEKTLIERVDRDDVKDLKVEDDGEDEDEDVPSTSKKAREYLENCQFEIEETPPTEDQDSLNANAVAVINQIIEKIDFTNENLIEIISFLLNHIKK